MSAGDSVPVWRIWNIGPSRIGKTKNNKCSIYSRKTECETISGRKVEIRQSAANEMLHGSSLVAHEPGFFAAPVTVLDGLALVMELLAFGKGDVHLGAAAGIEEYF